LTTSGRWTKPSAVEEAVRKKNARGENHDIGREMKNE